MGIFFNLCQIVLLSLFNTAQSQKWLDPCVALDWCNDNGDCAALSSSEAKCLCKKGFVGKTCSEKGDESHWWHDERTKKPPGKDLCEELNWCSDNGDCWEKSPTGKLVQFHSLQYYPVNIISSVFIEQFEPEIQKQNVCVRRDTRVKAAARKAQKAQANVRKAIIDAATLVDQIVPNPLKILRSRARWRKSPRERLLIENDTL
jgi:hypothetical protein